MLLFLFADIGKSFIMFFLPAPENSVASF